MFDNKNGNYKTLKNRILKSEFTSCQLFSSSINIFLPLTKFSNKIIIISPYIHHETLSQIIRILLQLLIFIES